ncbi:MAG: SDR family NAD(P)-dependent oxidoreductase, partial [Sulfuricella sp.]|nr:SDR family NAD(P)-dependent oxidoreductase [Sulfuricella sp.]
MRGKVVLITGGAKRVGASICRRLHREGANLVIHYRSSAAEAEALCDELNRLRPDSATLAQADLHQVEHLAELVGAAVGRFG